ncbi:mortality factor 4-like protein 1 isoform X2 [Tetranychus urticae]|uniref:mortality factor 4-like protein 1 isoform X2 n=1 Tax=Tetranychus urticae TaxID=32264 RepID=UPI00077BF094|nr:mortality factor 4-like protein 1 isoform X2 [Tetranychus urticae]
MPPKTRFQEGERILCFHGPLLYEAKCLKVAPAKSGVFKYFVHYQGWNKSWDEWVPESRVLKYNETNVAKQKELQESYKYVYPASNAAKTKSKSKGKKGLQEPSQNNPTDKGTKQKLVAEVKETTKEGSKSKRPKVEAHVEGEDCYANKLEIRIKMPDELKPLLMDDWDLITRQKKLCSQLLYKFERPQYQQFLHENPGKELSSHYGFIHLLRLFARLGGILIYTSLDEKEMQLLLSHIHDFLKFMAKSTGYYSSADYDFAPPEYHKKAVQ